MVRFGGNGGRGQNGLVWGIRTFFLELEEDGEALQCVVDRSGLAPSPDTRRTRWAGAWRVDPVGIVANGSGTIKAGTGEIEAIFK